MKKTIGIVLILLIGVYLTYRLVNKAPSSELTTNEQMVEIMNSGQCLACHNLNPDKPFYASWPIVGKIVMADIIKAQSEIDLTSAYNALINGEKVDVVSLNKIEKTIMDDNMPQAKYYLAHWGSSINRAEKQMVLNWAKEHRATYYNNNLVADKWKNEPVQPIPDKLETDENKVRLGKMLYYSTLLSADNTISCASCHDFDKGGTDNRPFSVGYLEQVGGVNAPTVFNAYFNFVQFWDGRAENLAAQAAGPPLNPIEMASKDFDEICTKLAGNQEIAMTFNEVYPDGITEKNICDAIAEFEKTLLTPNCPFDQYLKGDDNAISENAKSGYELFKKYNCATCHGGINIGGQSYELLGLKADYFKDRGTTLTEEDYGRGKQEEDIYYDHRFKTPTLRNLTLTAPYFHDATQATIEDAVKAMMKYEIGKNISEDEVKLLVEFLETLTGEIPQK